MKMQAMMLAAVMTAGLAGTARAARYEIDAAHSEVRFRIGHLMVGRTTGRFTKFAGWFDYDAKNPKAWAAQASIEAASIDTDNEKRDEHLRSADFFDTAKYPRIEFVSTGLPSWRKGRGSLAGKLTIHGVEKPVTLELIANGEVKDPWGGERAGFTARGRIDRRDFGLLFNQTLDRGGLAIANEVDIEIEVEGVKKAESGKSLSARSGR